MRHACPADMIGCHYTTIRLIRDARRTVPCYAPTSLDDVSVRRILTTQLLKSTVAVAVDSAEFGQAVGPAPRHEIDR